MHREVQTMKPSGRDEAGHYCPPPTVRRLEPMFSVVPAQTQVEAAATWTMVLMGVLVGGLARVAPVDHPKAALLPHRYARVLAMM